MRNSAFHAFSALLVWASACFVGCRPTPCHRESTEHAPNDIVACSNNLRQLSILLHTSSMDTGWKCYAPDLTNLLPFTADAFFLECPSAKRRRVSLARNEAPRRDYFYVSGVREWDPPTMAHLICPPRNHDGTGLVCSVGGTVSVMDRTDIEKLIARPWASVPDPSSAMLHDYARRIQVIPPGDGR